MDNKDKEFSEFDHRYHTDEQTGRERVIYKVDTIQICCQIKKRNFSS